MRLAFLSPRPLVTLLALGIAAAACSSGGAPSASVSPPVSPSPSLAPSPTPKPIVAPRPTDLPTDGECEQGYACLGLLEPGITYQAETFQPAFHFQVPSSDWENLSEERGVLVLLNLAHPGDVIAFFRDPQATDEDGLVPDVGDSAQELAAWLEAHPQLEVTPAEPARLGGLPALVLEARVANEATASDSSGCPTQVCVPLFQGSDREDQPPWRWDWGFTQSENARIFLVTSEVGVVAVFVDANDGTTRDSLNEAANQIFRTLKFE
jgi:hypothetical protein